MKRFLTTFGVAMLVAISNTDCSAQTFTSSGTDARVVAGTTNSRDDNNGGNTVTGALIGLNTGGIDNYMLYKINDLASAAGETVYHARVTLEVATGFRNGNHGSAADTINLYEIALPNAGWVSGTGQIGGADNLTDNGSASFLNRIQYNDDPGPASGTSEAWKDAGGSDVGNLLGSLTLLDSVPGYAADGLTPTLTFDIDAATAQSWVDNGLAGLALGTTDDGDSRSRFNFRLDAASLFLVVPEPSSIALMCMSMLGAVAGRRRRAAA